MTADEFRCICDPAVRFEPDDPRPVAVEGCPAHRARRAVQLWIREPMFPPLRPGEVAGTREISTAERELAEQLGQHMIPRSTADDEITWHEIGGAL